MGTIGSRIKAERKRAGMTQAALAKKIGVSFQTVAQWENNLRNPKFETVSRIADALGVSVFDFYQKLPHLNPCGNPAEKTPNEISEAYKLLNGKGRQEALKRIKELIQLPQYTD